MQKSEIDLFKQNQYLSYQVLKVEKSCLIDDFAKEKNISKTDCMYENSNLIKGQYVIFKPKKYKIHIVRPNQTVEEIAKIYNVSTYSIFKNNNINAIFTGMQLKI